VAQAGPVLCIIIVHRSTPAEDIVADKEPVDNRNRDPDHHNTEENKHQFIQLPLGNRPRVCQRLLDQIVEWPPPVVERNTGLYGEISNKNDECGAQNGPALPRMRAILKPEGGEQCGTDCVINIKPEKIRGPEKMYPDNWRGIGGRWRQADIGTPAVTPCVP